MSAPDPNPIHPRPAGVPWYASGIRFQCRRCGQCCRGEPGVVWVTRQEIDLISSHLGMSRKEFRAKYLRRIGLRTSLTERPDGDCGLYHNGCSVYPVRPSQCRTFPFWEDALRSPAWFQRALRGCPGVSHGKLYSREEIDKRSCDGLATESPDDTP